MSTDVEQEEYLPSPCKLVATLFASSISQDDIEKTISALQDIIDESDPADFSYRYLSSINHRPHETDRPGRQQAVDVSFSSRARGISLKWLRRHDRLLRLERECNVEMVLQEADEWRKEKRLAVFDMDSTLIEQEVIDELARVIGVEDEVSVCPPVTIPRNSSNNSPLANQRITARAMNGELDFTASLRARVALLQGVPGADVWDHLKSNVITFTPGARELCRALKRKGFKLAVLSGGFTPLADWVKQELGLDYAYANNLVLDPETSLLTGQVTGPIVDATHKAELLEQIAQREQIPLHQTIAVGDGANDLLMMRKAGVGVAFNAKESVKIAAPTKLTSPTLLDILYILGYTKTEQDELLRS
ncbi:MAG: hypothetical protein M1837_007227 [Sclerophora amabilis]|nr:MAG: hypothetical protein M1837_007227 [Sclerophora amabilis]